MREHHVRRFDGHKLDQFHGAVAGHFGGAVDLPGEDCFCPENLARSLALGAPNCGGFVIFLSQNAALASREVDDNRAVPQLHVPRQRPCAARLRIVRMAANTYDF